MRSFDDFKRYHNANYHDGDSHFDERIYSKSNGDDFDCSFVQDCFDHFEAGAASRQAEIDELQKRLAMYEREGYKLVPLEPTKSMLRELSSNDVNGRMIYKAMIGACDD